MLSSECETTLPTCKSQNGWRTTQDAEVTCQPGKGWKEMVRYVLEDTAVKLPVHMDQTPYFWPDEDKTMTKEKMLEKVGTSKEEEEKKAKAKLGPSSVYTHSVYLALKLEPLTM